MRKGVNIMRKLFALVLILCLCAVSLSGLAQEAAVYTGTAPGFGGEVKVSFTLDENGRITGVKVTGDQETPAIGGQALEPRFQAPP